MQEVSQAFLTAVAQAERQTAVEIQFGLYDTSAQGDAAPSITGAQTFSNGAQLVDGQKILPDYATLEQDRWRLDGTASLFPDQTDGKEWGLWSAALSDAQGTLAQQPEVDIVFSEPHSSVGLTLWFDTLKDDYPKDFTVTWYDGQQQVLASYQAADNTQSCCKVMVGVENYQQIHLTFENTNRPYRYLRLAEIDFGVSEVYDGDSLMSSGILQEMDPLTSRVSAGRLNFVLDNSDSRFNILNPQGIYRFLQRRQKFEVRFGVLTASGWEWMNWGIYYLKEWENPNALTTKLTAYDVLDLLDQINYPVSPLYQEASAADILTAIFTYAGITDYVIDAGLQQVKLSGYLKPLSCREAIHQTAVAAGATVRVDCNGCVRVETVPDRFSPVGALDYSLLLEEPQIKQLALVDKVEVSCLQYALAKETTELYSGTLALNGEQSFWLAFNNNPAEVSAVTVSGGEKIAETRYANGISLTLSGQGEATVVITGKTYTLSSTVVQTATETPPGEVPQTAQISDNTLIGTVPRAQQVAQRLLQDSGRRYQQTFAWWANPAYEIGDVVTLQNRYEEPLTAQLTKSEYSFNGGVSATSTSLGCS